MDNQKDQFGTTPDQTNAGRPNTTNTPAPASTASGTPAASRKLAPSPSASDSTSISTVHNIPSTPNAQAQTTANAQEGTMLDTALNSGKKWVEDSGVLNSVNQLPQSLKDLGNRTVDRINGLSTTQKVVGSAILAAGIGWLAVRKGKSSSSDSSDGSAYSYGRQRDADNYGRKSYGYQAPDASTSHRPAMGTSGRSDSGSMYGNGGSRFASSGHDNTEAGSAGNTGIKGSGRDDSGASYGDALVRTDYSTEPSGSDYRSIE